MRILRYTIIAACVIILFFTIELRAQIGGTNDDTWNVFKASAHSIGFCIYHVQQDPCTAHSDIQQELEEISDPESDVYYFQPDASWAIDRLNNWAETNGSDPDHYLILFDIDQKSVRQLNDSTVTSNSSMMFSILDLRNQYIFQKFSTTNSGLTFKIVSNRPQSILSNTLWREFMSNRSGKLENEISISLSGPNALHDYANFKAAFLKFIGR